jgi:hypothetical protein
MVDTVSFEPFSCRHRAAFLHLEFFHHSTFIQSAVQKHLSLDLFNPVLSFHLAIGLICGLIAWEAIHPHLSSLTPLWCSGMKLKDGNAVFIRKD